MKAAAARPPIIPAMLRDSALSILLNDSSMAVTLLDIEGCFLFANDTLREAHGLTEDFVGRHASDVAPDLWNALAPSFDALREGCPTQLERTSAIPGCPSCTRHWSERWRPLRSGGDEGGEVLAILGTAVDVTERRAERDEQERLADLRGRLIETASHELRGPLASVLGFAHRLTRDEHLPPPAAEAAEFIREQAQEMAFRLDLFLGVSELDTPPGVANVTTMSPPEEVRVDDLLAREAEALRARRPGIKLDVHCPSELSVHSNPHYMRQIVASLLDNAAKYGSGWIGLAAHRTDRHLVVRVEDDGDGVTSDEQGLIFARGYRAESARARVASGRGLGLFVAREFAERLGGSLTLQSETGTGATFLLRIPLKAPRRPRRHVVHA